MTNSQTSKTSRYVFVQRKDGVALATKWINDAEEFGLGPNTLMELDFEPFLEGVSTKRTYEEISKRNAHLIKKI